MNRTAIISVAAAIAAGTVSGFAFSSIHPGPTGPQGAVGKAGVPGPAGPAGAAGSAAAVGNLGVCFNVNTTSQGGTAWVSGVSVHSPQVNKGVVSCPIGSYVSVQPQGN